MQGIPQLTAKEIEVITEYLHRSANHELSRRCNDIDETVFRHFSNGEKRGFANKLGLFNSGDDGEFDGIDSIPDFVIVGYGVHCFNLIACDYFGVMNESQNNSDPTQQIAERIVVNIACEHDPRKQADIIAAELRPLVEKYEITRKANLANLDFCEKYKADMAKLIEAGEAMAVSGNSEAARNKRGQGRVAWRAALAATGGAE